MPNAAHSEGVNSSCTEVVNKLARTHFSATDPASNDVTLKCWTLPENELYMGIEQRLHIKAPLDAVNKVIDEVNDYGDLFPGYKKVELRNREKNGFTVFFEQKVPLFFVPNIKFEMIYEREQVSADQVLYKYHLKERGKIKASDGFILLTKTDKNETDYIEYDFLDAEWGLGGALGKDKLWSEVVDGIYWSDLSIRGKAEHPDKKAEEARDLAEDEKKSDLVKNCVKSRSAWQVPTK